MKDTVLKNQSVQLTVTCRCRGQISRSRDIHGADYQTEREDNKCCCFVSILFSFFFFENEK